MIRIRKYPVRLFEWVMAWAMLSVALTVWIFPSSIQDSSFHFMSQAGFTPTVAVWFYGVVGSLRIFALVINGRSLVHGPLLRFVGSVSGILIWSEMAVALLQRWPFFGSPSIGVGIYLCLAAGEIWAAYRAATDMTVGRKIAGDETLVAVHKLQEI
jgi:hypothetical protein